VRKHRISTEHATSLHPLTRSCWGLPQTPLSRTLVTTIHSVLFHHAVPSRPYRADLGSSVQFYAAHHDETLRSLYAGRLLVRSTVTKGGLASVLATLHGRCSLG
jgi:hypothetical protein